MNTISQDLQSVLDQQVARGAAHGILMAVQSGDEQIDFAGAAGAAQPDQRFFMASITKMVTTAVLMQLVDEKRLTLDDPVAAHLPSVNLSGLTARHDRDNGPHLTLRQLVFQTSGLADYYADSFAEDVKHGRDRAYGLTQVLDTARRLPPPRVRGRAKYSDTNFQLLGAVIAAVTAQPFRTACAQRIFGPAGMTNSTIFHHAHTDLSQPPVALHSGQQRIDLPRTLTSMGADGGGLWTLRDGLRFLRSFFAGDLFNPAHFADLNRWSPLFFPLEYGGGIMRYKLPRWITLFRETPAFIGHSGASGSWAFWAPREDIYLVGSYNQLNAAARPFRLLPQVMRCLQQRAQA